MAMRCGRWAGGVHYVKHAFRTNRAGGRLLSTPAAAAVHRRLDLG